MERDNQPPTDTDALRLLQESPELQFDAQEQHERLLEIETELTYDAAPEQVGIEIVQDDQIAVNGLKPDKKGVTQQLSNQDIIDMALARNPQRPLKIAEIHELSGRGEFVSLQALKTRWGSRKNFNIACGFDG